jgi:DNA helicase HerA-like ATPase
MVNDAPVVDLHPLVTLVEEGPFDSFGFYLFRVDYDDDDRWNLFLKEYDVVLHSYIASAPDSSGLARISDRFEVIVVEDEVLDGAGSASVARFVGSA